MQFIYYPSPLKQIVIKDDLHKYLFKVRRIKENEIVHIRDLKDDYLYTYKIENINKKEALLTLINKEIKPNKPKKYLHLAWCIIDTKNIEKHLPTLNEIGVSKITFLYCKFSQKNFKINLDRLNKILINSSQQCGRSNLIEIEILNSFEEFIKKYPNFIALDFNGKKVYNIDIKKPILIGPEGGFCENERKYFKEIISLDGFILRSESAACAISAKILL